MYHFNEVDIPAEEKAHNSSSLLAEEKGRCMETARSWPEPVTEHLVGRESQTRGTQLYQLYVMPLSDQKEWSQDPSLPRHQLRVSNGGESILLGIPARLRSSESK